MRVPIAFHVMCQPNEEPTAKKCDGVTSMLHRNSFVRIASVAFVFVVALGMCVQGPERQQLERIVLPDGFQLTVYSADVPNARQMAFRSQRYRVRGVAPRRKCVRRC